jgi:hypothetical protein
MVREQASIGLEIRINIAITLVNDRLIPNPPE